MHRITTKSRPCRVDSSHLTASWYLSVPFTASCCFFTTSYNCFSHHTASYYIFSHLTRSYHVLPLLYPRNTSTCRRFRTFDHFLQHLITSDDVSPTSTNSVSVCHLVSLSVLSASHHFSDFSPRHTMSFHCVPLRSPLLTASHYL